MPLNKRNQTKPFLFAFELFLLILLLLYYHYRVFHMAYYWRLSDNKAPQVSRTLLSILTDFNHALVWILRAILNKSRRQCPTRHQLYGHLPPIAKTIQVRRTRHSGHCWRSRDELISDVLLWTPTYGRAKAGRPARTYIQQLCEDTGCSREDLPEAMKDREKWREWVKDIRACGTTWWWWVWIVTTCLPISNSSSPLTESFRIVPSPPITNWIVNYLRVFHTCVSWWSFTVVWVTASLLRSPGFFSVF